MSSDEKIKRFLVPRCAFGMAFECKYIQTNILAVITINSKQRRQLHSGKCFLNYSPVGLLCSLDKL